MFYGRLGGDVGEGMDPLKVGLLVGLVAVSVLGVLFRDYLNRRKAVALLGGRTQLDSVAFGRRYFGQSEARAAIAAEVREIGRASCRERVCQYV